MSDLKLYKVERKKTTGRRNDKIASQIRECFSVAISRGDFPILPGHEDDSVLKSPVTITYVDLSPDLRNAVVYYMPLGGMHIQETAKFFELQVHSFKNVIAKKMRLRFIPNIVFKLDDSFEYSQKIDCLFDRSK